MALTKRSVLGIDINSNELRVVELRGSGASAQVTRLGAVPPPTGSIDGGRIVYPEAVAETLRGLLKRLNTRCNAAVLGIGSQSVISRVLEIPPVPPEEIHSVIEGELRHYQILRSGAGAFDYVPIEPINPNTNANTILLMATEEATISGYREVAEAANLQIIAMEPILPAIYRGVSHHILAEPAVMVLLITYSRTEITIVDHGKIRLYRRVDIGSDDLISGRLPHRVRTLRPDEKVSDRILLNNPGEEEVETEEIIPGTLQQDVAETLAIEAQRSLDYYRREYPASATVARLLIATNDPDIEQYGEHIAETLRIDARMADAPVAMAISRQVASQMEAPNGLRYLGAVGLAMHSQQIAQEIVPRFDLSVRERHQADTGVARQRFTAALVAGLVIILAGLLIALSIGQKANQLSREVVSAHENLNQLTNQTQTQLANEERSQSLYEQLRLYGYAWPRILDGVSAAVPSSADLTSVGLNADGALDISGDADNAQAIIDMMKAMQQCPYFEPISLDSLITPENNTNQINPNAVFTFRLKTSLVGSPASLPPPPANGG